MSELLGMIAEAFSGLLANIVLGTSQKRIDENLKELMKLEWFQTIYKNPDYRILIEKHMGVQTVLGSVKMIELKKDEQKMQKFREKFVDFIQKESTDPNAYKHFTL
ncbi:hypothetical protein [Bacillus smithii]|uniref:hypothetical protein n=1 Tax=Bacillus smithii TaxID=1479 RepID=UPI003D1B4ACD